MGGFQHSGEYPWSGYKETDRGGGVELAFPSVFGSHSVRWEGVWRDLGCLSNSTAFAVREQAGHSLKSSLKASKDQGSHRSGKVFRNQGKTVFSAKIREKISNQGNF